MNMQVPAALTTEAKDIIEAAQRIATGFGHVAVDPEHVVHAFIASDTEAARLLVSGLSDWQKSDLMRRFRVLSTRDGVVDPDVSSRLSKAMHVAIDMGGEIHHLSSAVLDSYVKSRGGEYGRPIDGDLEMVQSAEEKKATDERLAADERRYEEEHKAQEALAHARNVTAKKVSLNYVFDAETGAHTVDLKIEAGPGFAENASGPHAIKGETSHAVIELVGRALGAKKRPPPDMEDGDGEYLGSLNGNIFD